MSESHDEEDDISRLLFRLDWEHDGTWDTDWISGITHVRKYEAEGEYTVRVEVKDTEGMTHNLTQNLTVTNSHHMVPSNSPFRYNVGINYETATVGRNNRIVSKDLDTITKYFRLIRTYHAAAVGTTEIIIDPFQGELIKYIVDHQELELELVMGTNNSALAAGGYGHPWGPGLMTSKAYTDKWLQMLIETFGSKANLKKHLKAILLGNEVDANGPPPGNEYYSTYYTQWVPEAFKNLKASLTEASLDEIPVSTTIANYNPVHPEANIRADSITAHITRNWNPLWNIGIPFVLFNQYTGNYGKSTDFGPVIKYFESLHTHFNSKPDVYVGETGFSAEYGLANEASVIKQIFDWPQSQYSLNKLTVPLFVFMAYDHPEKSVGQQKMGIFQDDSNNKPVGLKKNIKVPEWVSQPKN